MASSGKLCREALLRTGVSEELSASIIRLSGIGEVGTTLAVSRCIVEYVLDWPPHVGSKNAVCENDIFLRNFGSY
jgi:hypothetical protein